MQKTDYSIQQHPSVIYATVGLTAVLIGLGITINATYGVLVPGLFALLILIRYLIPKYFIIVIFASFIAIPIRWTSNVQVPINFSLLECIVLPIAGITILSKILSREIKAERKGSLRRLLVLWLLFLLTISLGFLHARNSLDVAKELLKWVEIGLLSTAVFIYVDRKDKFMKVYWFLFLSIFYLCLQVAVVNIRSGELFGRLYLPANWGIVLLLPFINKRWAQVILFTFFLPLLVLTYSRIAWFITVVAFTAFLFTKGIQSDVLSRIKKALVISFVLGLALILIIDPFRTILFARIGRTFSDRDQSMITRLAFYKSGLSSVAETPFLGVGAGNFKEYLLATRPDINFWLSLEALPENPHAVLLQYLVELGLPGLMIFGLMVILFWKTLIFTRRRIDLFTDRAIHRYILGINLYFIIFLVRLFLAGIGARTRILWGVYFGLVLSLLRVLPSATLYGVRETHRSDT